MAVFPSSAPVGEALPQPPPERRTPPPRRFWYAPGGAVVLAVVALLTARIHWSVPVVLIWIFAPVVIGLRAWWVRGERSRPPLE